MTDANSGGVAETAVCPGTLGAATGTACIVFGGIRQYAQLLFYLHLRELDEISSVRVLNDVTTGLSADSRRLLRGFLEVADFLFGVEPEIEIAAAVEFQIERFGNDFNIGGECRD